MAINIQLYRSALQCLLYQHLRVIYLWMLHRAWGIPASIKVISRETCSVITQDYSVRVQHWNYLKDVLVSESVSFLLVAEQELDHAFNNEACL